MEQNIVSWREELQASTWGSGGEEDTHTHAQAFYGTEEKIVQWQKIIVSITDKGQNHF